MVRAAASVLRYENEAVGPFPESGMRRELSRTDLRRHGGALQEGGIRLFYMKDIYGWTSVRVILAADRC